MTGPRLGDRYEILRELGRGGMGTVYLARDPLLDREVAIKVVPPGVLNAEAGERLRREARTAARLDHPAIVPVHDLGEHEGTLFFVMPVILGTTLKDRGFEVEEGSGEGQSPPWRALRSARQGGVG